METIEVGYKYIGSQYGIEFYHKFLIYTDKNGNQTTIAGFAPYSPVDPNNLSPDPSLPYGNIDIKIDEPYDINNPDHPDNPYTGVDRPQYREPVTQGEDLSDIWDNMMEDALNRDGKYPYDPASQNCGTLADQLLRDAGLPEPSNDNIFSPGEHWVPGSGNELDEGVIPINPKTDPVGALERMIGDGIIDLLDGIAAGQIGKELSDLMDDLGKGLGDILAQLPEDLVPDILGGILDGLQAALPGGLFTWLFDLIPNELNPELKSLWELAQNWVRPVDPLVLDLDGDGIETLGISTTTHVLFDSDGDRIKTGIGWVKSDDGLLVLDRNGNGVIDNGSELFGDQTIINGTKATSGFDALRTEDTNGDGKFDANDTNFSNVRVWRDMDSDGVSDSGELFTLNELGITSINLTTATTNTTNNTNTITDTGTYTKSDGTTATVANLNFISNNFYSDFTDKIALDETALLLPNVSGSGMVRDLREASMLSSDLTTVVQNMQNQDYVTKEAFMSQMDTMLLEWANTSNMLTSVELAESLLDKKLIYMPTSSVEDMRLYVYGIKISSDIGESSNTTGTITFATPEEQSEWERLEYLHSESERLTKLVEILERFNGETFTTIEPEEDKILGIGDTAATDWTKIIVSTPDTTTSSNGTGYITIEPPIFLSFSAAQVDLLEESYKELRESVYGSMVLSTRLKSYIDAIEITIDENGIRLDMNGVSAMLNGYANTDIKNALIDWNDLVQFGGAKFDMIDKNISLELQNWVTELANIPEMIQKLKELEGIDFGIGIFHIGSENNDNMSFALSENNFIISGIGNDTIMTGKGHDTVYSGTGDDTITIKNSSSNTIYCGDGNDTVTTYYSTTLSNTVDGGNGNDIITLGSGNDIVYGGDGNDVINSGDGNDIIMGGAGDDIINGYYGNDTYLFGRGDGKDIITDIGINTTKDILKFTDGINMSDVIAKVDGNNLILGIKEDSKTWDELSDKVTLKNWFASASYRVETIEFNDGTTLSTTDDIIKLLATDGNDFIKSTELSLNIDAGAGDDTITITNTLVNTIYCGDGNDTVTTYYSTTLSNTVDGGNGNDIITLGSGNDIVYGGDGNDVINSGDGNDIIMGGAGDDIINGYYGNDTYLFGRGDGKDIITDIGINTTKDILKFTDGINMSDVIAKVDGNNLILGIKEDSKTWDELSDKVTLKNWFASASYRVETIEFNDGTTLSTTDDIIKLLATDGNDFIKSTELSLNIDAGAGDDTITTGSGSDIIHGGDGNDKITTGSGADIIVLNSMDGYDSVLDFSASQDKFQLDSTVFESLVDLKGVLSVDNISFGANTTVAKDENDYIIYNQTNGNIFYDADGSGSVYAAILIADITNNLALNNTQFVVI
ncbi:MAG: calcium-binding protein [Sulfurovaceae bacterium]|nr:calcium-binding protein [Sulfurovaceae bacterium]